MDCIYMNFHSLGKNIISIGGWFIQLENSTTEYYKGWTVFPEEYVKLEDIILTINDNTFFLKYPNWIIKISKWWWINNFFETVYVYSKEEFKELPHRMHEKINDQVITYLNHDSTYSASNLCNVK